MMYINNFINLFSDSDTILYVIILCIFLISLILFYLLYTQNKEMKNKLKETQEKVDDNYSNTESRVKTAEDLPKENNLNNIIEENELIQLSDIPNTNSNYNESWKDDTSELQNITKELENVPKDRKIKMTPYEEEQEEKAIISYEELLSRTANVSINYSNVVNDEENNISVKQVDLEKTGQIELDPIKRELNKKVEVKNYRHEEEFLEELKELKKLLN